MAYFLGSQKDLGPLLLDDEEVGGALASDLGLGGVLLEHSPDYREGAGLRQALEAALAPRFAPLRLHLLLLEDENPPGNMPPSGVLRPMPWTRSLPAGTAGRS